MKNIIEKLWMSFGKLFGFVSDKIIIIHQQKMELIDIHSIVTFDNCFPPSDKYIKMHLAELLIPEIIQFMKIKQRLSYQSPSVTECISTLFIGRLK